MDPLDGGAWDAVRSSDDNDKNRRVVIKVRVMAASVERSVDRGVAGRHFPRRRAPPEVAGAAVWCGSFAAEGIGAGAARTVPASCLCSQSR